MGTCITFEHIERDADRTLGVVLLAKTTPSTLYCAFLIRRVAGGLNGFVNDCTPEFIQGLSETQADALKKRLQEIHAKLTLLCSRDLGSVRFLAGPISRLEKSQEDLGDIIEELALIHDKDFKSLLKDAASSLGLSAR